MSGIVLKDLLVLRKQGKSYAMIIGIYALMSLAGIFDYTMLSSMAVVIVMMLPITSFSYDELARWDKYAASTPAGRRGVVQAKYVTTFIISGLVGLICLAIDGVMALITPEADFKVLVLTLLASLAAGFLINAIVLPLMFKYGAEKSRAILVGVMAIGLGAMFVLSRLLKSMGLVNLSDGVAVCLAAVLVIGGLIISYLLSQKIFSQKEL